jgi:hypothetical protein
MATLRADLTREVIRPAMPASLLDERCRLFINPTGRFVIGGPHGDTGATGRKSMVDTYGGLARHGGGSFSGKDPTKVDRSASYTLRQAAKSIVAVGLARRCELRAAYVIGETAPISLGVETFGSGRLADQEILALVQRHFDLTPSGMIAGPWRPWVTWNGMVGSRAKKQTLEVAEPLRREKWARGLESPGFRYKTGASMVQIRAESRCRHSKYYIFT